LFPARWRTKPIIVSTPGWMVGSGLGRKGGPHYRGQEPAKQANPRRDRRRSAREQRHEKPMGEGLVGGKWAPAADQAVCHLASFGAGQAMLSALVEIGERVVIQTQQV
jgi:hypothetical protein